MTGVPVPAAGGHRPAGGAARYELLRDGAVMKTLSAGTHEWLMPVKTSRGHGFQVRALDAPGAYAEYIRLRDDTLNYNESVLDIFKTYNTTATYKDQVRIVKGRKVRTDDHGDPRFHSFISNITNTAYSSLAEDIQKVALSERSFLAERIGE